MAPRTPLVRPRRYFGRADRPSLAIATVAVLVLGFATAGVVFWVVAPLAKILDIPHNLWNDVLPLVLNRIRAEATLAFVLTLLAWLGYAILLWLVVRVVTDDGELRVTVGIVGEATLAVLALLPLKLLALWHFVATTSDPTANAPLGVATVYWGSLPLLAISLLGLAWKIGVVAGGMVAVTDLDWRKTTAAVAVFGAITSPFATIIAYYAVYIYLI